MMEPEPEHSPERPASAVASFVAVQYVHLILSVQSISILLKPKLVTASFAL